MRARHGNTLALCLSRARPQFVGMGKELYKADADVRALYQEANEALGYDLQRLCFKGPEEALHLTRTIQLAILVHSIAAWTVLHKRGCEPMMLAGHSLGEYSALVAASALADAVRLVHQRGIFMQDAVPPGQGSMAALLRMEPPHSRSAMCRVRWYWRATAGKLQRTRPNCVCR
ncbi:hypothetical protein NKDENANG_00249 [Candidatus Entotheonellaceae bacterium PAL068K]